MQSGFRTVRYMIGAIVANHLADARNDDYQGLRFAELETLRCRQCGLRQALIKTEVVLERMGRALVRSGWHAFLGFNRLVQAIGPRGSASAPLLIDNTASPSLTM